MRKDTNASLSPNEHLQSFEEKMSLPVKSSRCLKTIVSKMATELDSSSYCFGPAMEDDEIKTVLLIFYACYRERNEPTPQEQSPSAKKCFEEFGQCSRTKPNNKRKG